MKKLILLVVFFGFALSLFSQPGTDTLRFVIETNDGNEFTAKILKDSDDFLEVITDLGLEIKIPKSAIKSMKAIGPKDVSKGEYWFDNPHSTRYFYSPNGYNLAKGEGYYQNTWVFFNQVSYGFTDYFSLGAGMMPIFLVGAGIAPVWITPKIGFPVIPSKLNAGLGVLAATAIGDEYGLGIVYGTLSYGGRDKNATLGMGWAFTEDGWAKNPTFTLSAMARLSKKAYFITENYLISTPGQTMGLIALGGRSVQKKLAVDYGLVMPVNMGTDVFIAVPWLSITIPFGKNNTDQ